jgi:hypothetical protein
MNSSAKKVENSAKNGSQNGSLYSFKIVPCKGSKRAPPKNDDSQHSLDFLPCATPGRESKASKLHARE